MEVPWFWCICVSMNLKVLCLRMKSSIMRTIWVVRSLWVVAACILPWSESRILCLLCVECLCIGTWHQLWARWHWVERVGVLQWGWENDLCLWRVMGGCWLKARWNGWCRQRHGQLDHHTQKQYGGEDSLAFKFWVAHRTEVCGYF